MAVYFSYRRKPTINPSLPWSLKTAWFGIQHSSSFEFQNDVVIESIRSPAHFVLSCTSLNLIPTYSNQSSSGFCPDFADT
jgi:hypothetical protein